MDSIKGFAVRWQFVVADIYLNGGLCNSESISIFFHLIATVVLTEDIWVKMKHLHVVKGPHDTVMRMIYPTLQFHVVCVFFSFGHSYMIILPISSCVKSIRGSLEPIIVV